MYKNMKTESGFSIIEFITAMAIFVTIAVTGVALILYTFRVNLQSSDEIVSRALVKEGVEAVHSIRDQDWNKLAVGVHGLDKSNGFWEFSGSSDTDGKYTREISISEVYRDGDNLIVESGGNLDSDSRNVNVKVSWLTASNLDKNISQNFLLTNWSQMTVSVTPSPSPTPQPNSCSAYCSSQLFAGGNCRQNQTLCSVSGEIYSADGDQYCTGGPSSDVCCCVPVTSPAPTPDPNQPSTCNDYCVIQSYVTGVCRQNTNQCDLNGEAYESVGDQYCAGGPSSDVCCCGY